MTRSPPVEGNEMLGQGQVGNNPIAQRMGHCHPVGGAAQHTIGLGANGNNLVRV